MPQLGSPFTIISMGTSDLSPRQPALNLACLPIPKQALTSPKECALAKFLYSPPITIMAPYSARYRWLRWFKFLLSGEKARMLASCSVGYTPCSSSPFINWHAVEAYWKRASDFCTRSSHQDRFGHFSSSDATSAKPSQMKVLMSLLVEFRSIEFMSLQYTCGLLSKALSMSASHCMVTRMRKFGGSSDIHSVRMERMTRWEASSPLSLKASMTITIGLTVVKSTTGLRIKCSNCSQATWVLQRVGFSLTTCHRDCLCWGSRSARSWAIVLNKMSCHNFAWLAWLKQKDDPKYPTSSNNHAMVCGYFQ